MEDMKSGDCEMHREQHLEGMYPQTVEQNNVTQNDMHDEYSLPWEGVDHVNVHALRRKSTTIEDECSPMSENVVVHRSWNEALTNTPKGQGSEKYVKDT